MPTRPWVKVLSIVVITGSCMSSKKTSILPEAASRRMRFIGSQLHYPQIAGELVDFLR